MVHVYDADGINDVTLSDVVVRPGTGNAISSITLVGAQAKGGLGLAVSGASWVGKVADKRSLPGSVAFVVADSAVGALALKGGLSGYNLNGLTLGGVPLGVDIDGDGNANDLTGLWTSGGVGKLSLGGNLAADAVLGGTLASMKLTGSVAGDLSVAGALSKGAVAGGWGGTTSATWIGSASLGGVLTGLVRATGAEPRSGASVGRFTVGAWGAGAILAAGVGPGLDGNWFTGDDAVIGGGLGKLVIGPHDTAHDHDFGVLAPFFGSVRLGGLTVVPPVIVGQFRIVRVG
jgi:hypothetical protein